MRNFLKIAALGAMVAGSAMALGGTAQAASVGIDFGNVTLGFNDGYYDHEHNFHRWAARDAARWRREHYTQYYGWRHDDRHHRDYHYGH